MTSPTSITVLSILAAARQIEMFGIEFYSKVATCVYDDNGKALMRSLGKDEAKHKVIIEEEMRRISPGVEFDAVEPEQEYLRIIPKKVFPFPPEGTCLTVKDEIRAVEIGLQVEIDSIVMYQEAAGKVDDPNTRAVLMMLTGIEQKHRVALEESLQLLRTGGSWYGYSPILEG